MSYFFRLRARRTQLTGSSLKPIDIEFMRRLHQKVNLIPVIAKADTLTEEEVMLFKQRVCAGSARLTDAC